MADEKLSRNETLKEESRFLRGTIADGLEQAITGAISEDDNQLTKFHGIYMQDDRDLRPERGRKKMEKAYIFMARVRIPSGLLTPAQYLALQTIADERGNATLRLTTRQTVQFHGIIKSNLRPAIRAINASLLDTIAACGDVNRNVIATANPGQSRVHAEAAALGREISDALLPRTRAYHEIWIDDEQVAGGEEEDEPIYGRTYLPRKFKIAIAVPPRNDTDVFAHDLGLIAIVEDGAIIGYDVSVGGGMGMTHGEPDTYPRTGDVIGFCTPAQAVAVATAVVQAQRDLGNRADRKHARLKYTIDRVGLDAFRAAFEAHLGYALAPAHGAHFETRGDALGWHAGDDGLWHFGLFVENGRIHDRDGRRLGTGLAAIARVHRGEYILTANQNLVIAGVPAAEKDAIASLLAEHGLDGEAGGMRRNAMACVALPTCGLALAESERYLPSLIDALEAAAERVGLAGDEIVVRMTGCPNGCARPYLAEVALVGRAPGTYHLYLGGAYDGTRLNKLYRADVDHDGIVAAVAPLLEGYARERQPGERFGDWTVRAGHVRATTEGRAFHDDAAA